MIYIMFKLKGQELYLKDWNTDQYGEITKIDKTARIHEAGTIMYRPKDYGTLYHYIEWFVENLIYVEPYKVISFFNGIQHDIEKIPLSKELQDIYDNLDFKKQHDSKLEPRLKTTTVFNSKIFESENNKQHNSKEWSVDEQPKNIKWETYTNNEINVIKPTITKKETNDKIYNHKKEEIIIL